MVSSAPQLFLSYARPDQVAVEQLYQQLSVAGYRPWMDTKDILPGENWRSSIRRAIRMSDFFIACMSHNSVDRRGVLQQEIGQALDVWQGMLDSDIYVVPVRLAECVAPERLTEFQWVDVFTPNGLDRLLQALQEGMARRARQQDSDKTSSSREDSAIDLDSRQGISPDEPSDMEAARSRSFTPTSSTASVPQPQASTRREVETISMTDLRNQTREVMENAHFQGRRYIVERAGQPMVIIIDVREYEGLLQASEQLRLITTNETKVRPPRR